MDRLMQQTAPYPDDLADLVRRCRYKAAEGWEFHLETSNRGQGCAGLTLRILRRGRDAYHPERSMPVNHFMIVPAAAYNTRSWRRWLLEQIHLVELHELCENLTFEQDDGRLDRPYRPLHSDGNDPYMITELATDLERRTSFDGRVNPA